MTTLEELANSFTPMVNSVIKNYRSKFPKTTRLEDLKQEARVAIILAYKNYDNTRDCMLSTYVYHHIRWGLLTYLRRLRKELRVKTVSLVDTDISYDPAEAVRATDALIDLEETLDPLDTQIFKDLIARKTWDEIITERQVKRTDIYNTVQRLQALKEAVYGS